MQKALIVYQKHNEKAVASNEGKVADALEKLFINKGISVSKITLLPTKKLSIQDQLRHEKKIELNLPFPITQVKNFDFIVIGTPVVGSLTSAPAVNAFVRMLPKNNPKTALHKTKTSILQKSSSQHTPAPHTFNQSFVIYSTGIIPGLAIKKIKSLLSMNGIKALDSEEFMSIFDFDEKKMGEVKAFFERFYEKSPHMGKQN